MDLFFYYFIFSKDAVYYQKYLIYALSNFLSDSNQID